MLWEIMHVIRLAIRNHRLIKYIFTLHYLYKTLQVQHTDCNMFLCCLSATDKEVAVKEEGDGRTWESHQNRC